MVIVVAAELRDVDQALHEQAVEFDEDAVAGHRRQCSVEDLAYPIFHQGALEPGVDAALRLFGAAFGHGDVRRGGVQLVERERRFAEDHAVDQQVRVAADGRREVNVGGQRQAEVP